MLAGFELRLARCDRMIGIDHSPDLRELKVINEFDSAKSDLERLGIDAEVRQCPYGTKVMFKSEEDLNWFRLNVDLKMEGFSYRYA